ncbi:MAG: PQQ-binding-like beta-propeller repeat protein [Fimbriiglobus sp.]
MRFLPALAFGLLASALPAGDNWPEFRGPRGDGVSDATAVPTTWSEKENVRWKVLIHDKGWSSPVVWGDQVWVTTAEENGKKYYAVCVDRNTGNIVHDVHLFDEADPPKIKQFNTFASPTPAIEAGRLYAHFGTHGTACLDTATGKVLWDRRDLKCDHFRGPASSVAIFKDRLFLLFDGFDVQFMVCLEKSTGKTVWRKDRDLPYKKSGNAQTDGDFKKAFATASVFEVNGRPQVVSSAAIGTIAYDADTGEEVWRVITGGMNQASRPVLAHGLVYITAGHLGEMVAVKAGKTGDLTKTGVAWKLEKTGPTRPSPVVVGDLLFVVNDTGIAACLNAKTGKKLWSERLDGKFSASPVFAAGNVYFASENGKTFVVAAKPEFELVAENRLVAGCMGSPAVVGNDIILRTGARSETDYYLYCITKK